VSVEGFIASILVPALNASSFHRNNFEVALNASSIHRINFEVALKRLIAASLSEFASVVLTL
jgi:hypothetical protein